MKDLLELANRLLKDVNNPAVHSRNREQQRFRISGVLMAIELIYEQAYHLQQSGQEFMIMKEEAK